MRGKISRKRPKTTSVRRIAERLKQEIVRGALKPNQRMIEDDLAQRFGVSRTPIREALRSLESMKYVTFTPHRGWKVKQLSVDEVKEVTVIRAHLAAASTELACVRLKPADLAALEKILVAMISAVRVENVGEYFNLNVEFHEIIDRVAGNKTLSQMLNSLDGLTLRYRFLALSLPGRLAESLHEHQSIIEAFKKEDHEEAAKAAKGSALRSGSMLVRYLSQQEATVSV